MPDSPHRRFPKEKIEEMVDRLLDQTLQSTPEGKAARESWRPQLIREAEEYARKLESKEIANSTTTFRSKP